MNNMYHWHDAAMVALKMDEAKREMDSIRLLQDAGLSNPGIFERTAIAIGKHLVNLGQRLYKNHTEPQRAYPVTSGKFAA